MKGTWHKAQGTRNNAAVRRAGLSFIPRSSFFMICLMLLAPGMTMAQATNDPTRPPAGLGAADVDVGDTSGGMTLQSVIISPAGRAAIISGVVVKLGEKYGDAVLVKVAENEVVLKSGATSQVLKLYPGVEMRDIAPAVSKSTSRRAKARSKAAAAAGSGTAPR